jgi:hypothetical protein
MAEKSVVFGHVPGHMGLPALRPLMQQPRKQPCMAVHHMLELSATKFEQIFIELFSLLGKTQVAKPYIEVCKASFGSTRNEEHMLTLLRFEYSRLSPRLLRDHLSPVCVQCGTPLNNLYIVT